MILSLRALLASALVLVASTACADDWPQWHGPKRDSVWRETGILEKFPEGGPKINWRVPIDGGYAGPAVAEGRVYVTDYVTDGDRAGNPGQRPNLDGTERVLCLRATDGKLLWKHEYDCHYHISYPAGPRCTPTVHEGKVYTLGAEGHLFCLAAGDEKKILWSRDLKKDYKLKEAPYWGFAGHPLVEGDTLFLLVDGPGSIAVALNKDTGKEIWKALSADHGAGYCPPTMIEAGGTKQLIIWHADAINGLDPATGKVYWSVPIEAQYGMSIMQPRRSGDLLFVGAIGWKSVLLRLAPDRPAVEEVLRGEKNTTLYPVNSTPFLDGDYMYGIDQPGQLRGVQLSTGKWLWETLAATTGDRPAGSATAFLVKNGDRFFLANDKGELIIAKLSPEGYEEISRAKLLEPTGSAFGRNIVWSHPAFANGCIYARNDKEIVCASLTE